MIETVEALKSFLEPLRGDLSRVCAVDTEADSLYRYSERLCLIQLSDGERHELVDPLAINDLSSLSHYLSEVSVWMHGADYDMTMLQKFLGVVPPRVFDTQVGARLLGQARFGYGDLVETYLGVTLSKSSQKADWGRRPLTDKMSEYALNDVVYLLPLAEKIEADLRKKGRYEWFEESCDAARAKVMGRTIEKVDPWRINGSGRLNPRGLCFLKHLWGWRDVEAEEWNRPTFMVLTNKELLRWVETLTQGAMIEIPERYRSNRRKRLLTAIEAAKGEPSEDWPKKVRGKKRKLDDEFDQRVASLQSRRDTVAKKLEIDPSLIAPKAVLEALCLPEPESSPKDILLTWQMGLLGL